tara:strand:- start:1071 stop:1319 length:249 start_codon:yes stop_codon:yes gene_type:complete
MLEIKFKKQASKELQRIQPKIRQRIIDSIEKLAANPTRADLDLKPLVGSSYFRMRVGEYRVIYDQDGQILGIRRIAPRGSAY